MWTKLGMSRKMMTSSLRGLKTSISILKQDATKIGHLYGKSVIRGHGEVVMDNRIPLGGVRHYGSAAAAASENNNKGKSEKEKYDALRERRQLKLEMEAWSNALREYQELMAVMCEKKLIPNLPYIKKLFLGWFEPLKDAITAYQDVCKKSGNDRRGRVVEFIDCAACFVQLPADMMAVITMHKLMALLMADAHGYVTLVRASAEIGEAIEHEVKVHKFLEKSKIKPAPNSNVEGPATKEHVRLGKKVAELMKKQQGRQIRVIVNKNDDSKPWGRPKQVKVGAKMIQLLIETAYIQPPVHQPFDAAPIIRHAFTHALQHVPTDDKHGSKLCGIIQCDPLVRKGLEKSATHLVIPYMPMVVPPMDWIAYDKGAYLFLPSYVMRTQGRHQRVALKKVPKDQLETVFEALNTLGYTKWRINNKVLSIIDRIWASGGGGCLAGLVDHDDIQIPEKPDTDDASEIRKWKWRVRDVKKENAERHSHRCDVVLKLAVARKMKDEDGFYYPHNLDFRGRAYPMHSYLNHLGSDLCRGILEFAEGRPLGASGLRWLKIQMANLYAGGVDKLSYEGRIAFTENHVDDIFDSADRPWEGRRWWVNAEDPFQCLAACINLTEALRSSSPEDYVSYMPVHQDGSCNGLQHYAALGRDKLGAKTVNLVAGDKPADVYSDIAKRVLEIMRRDAEKDPSIEPNAPRAKLLLDQVDRALVKQTVMTSVYGVTHRGARDQIKRRLKEREIAEDSAVFAAAGYAAKVTMTAQGEMFQAARSIMSWLSDCAKVIASENQPVQWTTPVGLPVVQPYRKLGLRRVKTSLQLLTLRHETDKIMEKQQSTAFPPNFVHSLDASHMMMTAIACKRLGLTFAGVHDSYWTHACDVDEMNRILREKFVELYDQPILENLLESFQASFPKLEFPPLPERGDFDLRDVLEAPYFLN